MLRWTSLAVTAAFLAAAGPAAAKDYAPDALNIIPSGQYGALPVPAGADQQAVVFDGLTPLLDKVSDTAQTGALKHAGKEGRALLHDIDVYVKGINARLRFEKSSQKPWTRVDVYSINALAGQIFGQGGGDEVRRAQFLDALRKRLGASQANTVFNDLSEHLDADTPVTINKRFPYEQ